MGSGFKTLRGTHLSELCGSTSPPEGFNERRINQAKTGLFIQNLCETEHPGDYERVGIFVLEFRRDLERLYEMAPVRIELNIELMVNAM